MRRKGKDIEIVALEPLKPAKISARQVAVPRPKWPITSIALEYNDESIKENNKATI